MKSELPDLSPINKLLKDMAHYEGLKVTRSALLVEAEEEVKRLEGEVIPESTDSDMNRLMAAQMRRDVSRSQLPKMDGEIAKVNERLKNAVAAIRVPLCSNLDNDLLLAESAAFSEHLRPYVIDEGLRARVVSLVMPYLPYTTAVPTWRAFATHGPGRDSTGVTDAEFCMKAIGELKDYLKTSRK